MASPVSTGCSSSLRPTIRPATRSISRPCIPRSRQKIATCSGVRARLARRCETTRLYRGGNIWGRPGNYQGNPCIRAVSRSLVFASGPDIPGGRGGRIMSSVVGQVLRFEKSIGRIGALAVALGVGVGLGAARWHVASLMPTGPDPRRPARINRAEDRPPATLRTVRPRRPADDRRATLRAAQLWEQPPMRAPRSSGYSRHRRSGTTPSW